MSDNEFEKAVAKFVGTFEIVFRHDWPYTKVSIGDEAPDLTFLEPGLDDETEDWGARGALLAKCRRLVAAMRSRGLAPIFPFPLE